MMKYRLKMVSEAGMTLGFEDQQCGSDDVALNLALRLLPHCFAVEVWAGKRLILKMPNQAIKANQL